MNMLMNTGEISGRPITAATAVRRNVEGGRHWCVYLEEIGPVVDGRAEAYRLVMPDEDGTLPDTVLKRRTGMVVSWPTNPHSSGEIAILDRLNDSEARKVISGPVSCHGFARDQDGRHHRCS